MSQIRMNLLVKSDGYPELHQHLKFIPENIRCEEMRCLARIGLAFIKHGVQPVTYTKPAVHSSQLIADREESPTTAKLEDTPLPPTKNSKPEIIDMGSFADGSFF